MLKTTIKYIQNLSAVKISLLERVMIKIFSTTTKFMDIQEEYDKEIERLQEIEREIKIINTNLDNIKKNLDSTTNSIIDELYTKKKRKINYALIVGFIGIVFYYCANIIFNTDIKIEIIIFLYGSFILVLISKVLVSYRIKKGYYGMNFDECKELMLYLMNDIDKNDIDKGKRIFNETDDCSNVKERETEIVGEPQY